MEGEYPIIALEGLSATGKTTVGKILAEKTNGRYFHCKEGNPFEPFRQFFNKTPLPVSYFFYILYFTASLLRAKKLTKSSIVYMDKSAAWIFSHYKARNLLDIYFKFLPKYLSNGLDLILYFTVGESERKRRIKARMKKNKATINDVESIKTGEDTDKYYRMFSPKKLLEINIDNKKPEAIAEHIISILKKHKLI